MSEYFDPIPPENLPVDETGKEGGPGDNELEGEEPPDSDMEDGVLARALGASLDSMQTASSESLHTGLTENLEKLEVSTPGKVEDAGEPGSTCAAPPVVPSVAPSCQAAPSLAPPSVASPSQEVVVIDDLAQTPVSKKPNFMQDTVKAERIRMLKQLALITVLCVACIRWSSSAEHDLRQEIAKRQQALACARP